MRIKIFFYLIAIISIVLYAKSKGENVPPESIKGVKLIELTADELKSLGISVKQDKIEYFEKRQKNDGSEQKPNLSKIIITKKSVSGRNVRADVNVIIPKFYPRLVVNSFSKGCVVYYSRSIDFEEINQNSVQSILKDSVTNTYAGANNLVAVHIVLEQKSSKKKSMINDVYLWYEPTPEFLDALPKNNSDNIIKEIDTVKNQDSTVSGYTDNNREKMGAIVNTMLYPNPATGETVNLKFELSAQRIISVGVYDVSGKKVADLVQGESLFFGEHTMLLPIDKLESGMYLMAIVTDKGEQAIQRLIIVR